MSGENVAIVKGIYAAFGRGDVPSVLGAMSPDIVWNEAENFPFADGNPYHGPEAILNGVFGRCLADWEGFAVRMDDVVDGGDRVVAFGRYAGVHKQTGRAMSPQAVHVWTLNGGKVVAFQQYIDTLAVARSRGEA